MAEHKPQSKIPFFYMKNILIIIIFLSVSCKSNNSHCNQVPRKIRIEKLNNTHSLWVEKDSCNQLIEREVKQYSKDGFIGDGVYKKYYQNGALYMKTFFKNGNQDSFLIFYFPNGVTKETTYLMDGYIYKSAEFYQNSRIKETIFRTGPGSVWFHAKFDENGKMETMDGRLFVYYAFDKIYKVDDTFKVAVEVPEVDGLKVDLVFKAYNDNGILLDTSTSSFEQKYNKSIFFFKKRLSKVGKYHIDFGVSLFDKISNTLLVSDTGRRFFIVR